MDEYQSIISLIALSMGAAWASGINLYATLLMLGLMGATGEMTLPPDLQVLASPIVIAASGLMYMVEFTADKIPGVDNGWDAIHTVIRVPAGAVLAASVMGEVGISATIAAAIVGGGLSMSTHATKSGSRVLINTSPEPFSNFFVSISEDIAVIVGILTALNHPVLFLILLIAFILMMIWILPKIWGAAQKIFAGIKRFFKRNSAASNNPSNNQSFSEELRQFSQNYGQNKSDKSKKLKLNFNINKKH